VKRQGDRSAPCRALLSVDRAMFNAYFRILARCPENDLSVCFLSIEGDESEIPAVDDSREF
jgi:hypothetical protein